VRFTPDESAPHHHHCGYVGGGSALCCVRGVSRSVGIAALLWTILLRQLLSGKFIGYFDEFFDQGTGDALATTDRDPMVFIQIVTAADGGILFSQGIPVCRFSFHGDDPLVGIVFGDDQEDFSPALPYPQVFGRWVAAAGFG